MNIEYLFILFKVDSIHNVSMYSLYVTSVGMPTAIWFRPMIQPSQKGVCKLPRFPYCCLIRLWPIPPGTFKVIHKTYHDPQLLKPPHFSTEMLKCNFQDGRPMLKWRFPWEYPCLQHEVCGLAEQIVIKKQQCIYSKLHSWSPPSQRECLHGMIPSLF